MKIRRKWLLLIMMFVGLISILIWAVLKNDQETVEAAEEQVLKATGEIQAIDVFADQRVSLTKEGDNWTVPHVDQSIYRERVQGFITAMTEMKGEAIDVDRSSVALKFPNVTVKFTNQAGEGQRISVGQMHPNREQYYIEHMERQQVYLVDRTVIETIPLHPNDIVDQRLISIAPNQLQQITIHNGTEHIELQKESPYSDAEALAHISGWYMHEPYEGVYSVGFTPMQEILNGIEQLEATKTVDDESDVGLTDSNFSITFMSENQRKQTVVIGDPAPEQQYYAKVKGEDQIYTLETALLDPYSRPSFDMIDKFVSIISLDVLNQLTIDTSSGEKIRIEVDHKQSSTDQDGKQDFFINDKKIEEQSFRNMYQSVAGLTVDRHLKKEPKTEEADVTMTYEIRLENGDVKTKKVNFVSLNQEEFAVQLREQVMEFAIKKEKVYQAIETIRNGEG
ncbi:hypothetical protein J416_03206 [Gracilibacillus halophilus YIM-C55.5]|uniref:DUF4340 domain-containing protein n=1 Tax=Gracilibacillus halophilus YIM-C55.5 TaxID=1308866 RepID=N4WEZ5_9BACI|nr:DUF4340 domain-containing protein [Gracilibacillus halophilus]ENH97839.1 hypothetical protein J416_03206 [Gracilibacillus halophilus YIM-C55.5]